jgi:uncharacterized protein YndB with AHSA1/START domain
MVPDPSIEGKAQVERSTFRYTCSIWITIHASREEIWKLMTDSTHVTQWNKTLIGLEGIIGLNQDIRIKTELDPSRSFKLRVSEFEPSKKMVWSDGQKPFYKGTRIFSLEESGPDVSIFRFVQTIEGFFLMLAGTIPDFPGTFEKMAAGLKKAAEK